MSIPVRFIWDRKCKNLENYTKISENEITLKELRSSSGIEIDTETGIKSYFVLKPKTKN